MLRYNEALGRKLNVKHRTIHYDVQEVEPGLWRWNIFPRGAQRPFIVAPATDIETSSRFGRARLPPACGSGIQQHLEPVARRKGSLCT